MARYESLDSGIAVESIDRLNEPEVNEPFWTNRTGLLGTPHQPNHITKHSNDTKYSSQTKQPTLCKYYTVRTVNSPLFQYEKQPRNLHAILLSKSPCNNTTTSPLLYGVTFSFYEKDNLLQ